MLKINLRSNNFEQSGYCLKKNAFKICIKLELDTSCDVPMAFVFQINIQIHNIANIM